MILTVAVIAGLIAVLVRSKLTRQPLRAVELKKAWLVLLAFLPQLVAFGFPSRWIQVSNDLIPVLLVVSQMILIRFAWLNGSIPGGWLLGTGLLLNFSVIVLNRGWMPISPDAVRQLIPRASADSWQIGERLGRTKDMVLRVEDTRLWFLSDRIILPEFFNYPVAFSIGDIFIAAGAFWLIWNMVGVEKS